MPYTLKDVDAAEALVRKIRPGTLIGRSDYDWTLGIADKDMKSSAVILFRCEHENGRPEITSTEEEIRFICFMLGSQWTPEEIEKFKALRPVAPVVINRVNTP